MKKLLAGFRIALSLGALCMAGCDVPSGTIIYSQKVQNKCSQKGKDVIADFRISPDHKDLTVLCKHSNNTYLESGGEPEIFSCAKGWKEVTGAYQCQ